MAQQSLRLHPGGLAGGAPEAAVRPSCGIRVWVLRSGRHEQEAVRSIRKRFPDCELTVVSASAEGDSPGGGGGAHWRRRSGRQRRFSLWNAIGTGVGRAALLQRPDVVAVLWSDAAGNLQANASRVALLLGRGRFVAITPEGDLSWWTWRTWTQMGIRRRLDGVTDRLRRLVGRWRTLWQALEGPELEPYPWHSHYLAVRAVRKGVLDLSRRLDGVILDVGAGTGFGRSLLGSSARYIPADLPTGRDARDRTITVCGSSVAVACSGYELPVKDGSLNGVLLLSVLEHVTDPAALLREAGRVLKTGGRMLVLTPFAFPFHGMPADYRRWTSAGLAQEIRAAGLEVEESRVLGDSVSAVVLNLLLLLRVHLPADAHPVIRAALIMGLPLLLPVQGLLNGLAILLGRLDRRPLLPTAVAVLGRKGSPSGVVALKSPPGRAD